jgi:hypothetical protein
MLQMGLEEQPLHLAAFGLLQGLDLMEGELQGAAGCHLNYAHNQHLERRSRSVDVTRG